jgi:uncharacterized protein (TIGR02246 family)
MDPKLQELLDARAIERVMADYFDRVDALDPFGAAALFAEDATADLMTGKVYRGPAQIGRALARILLQYRHTSHHISNHRSEIDGDTAAALTYIYAFHRFPDGWTWHLWARHQDRLVKRDGEWKLLERVLVPIDAEPPWDLIADDWYRSHPGRRSHDELRAELEAAYDSPGADDA